MADDLPFEIFFRGKGMWLEFLPGGTLGFGNRCCESCQSYQLTSQGKGDLKYTFNALDFPRPEASKSSLMLGPGDSCWPDRTLEVRNWSTCGRATFTGSRLVRHCGLELFFGGERLARYLKSRFVRAQMKLTSGSFTLLSNLR
jgi:hypothetical protein